MTAASISRHLRSVGFAPIGSGSNREGLKVKSSSLGRVLVVADLDSDRAGADLAVAARSALVGAGYTVEPGFAAHAFYVTRPAEG